MKTPNTGLQGGAFVLLECISVVLACVLTLVSVLVLWIVLACIEIPNTSEYVLAIRASKEPVLATWSEKRVLELYCVYQR